MLLKSTMQAFDTSSIVYAWDNYPIEQFPQLWNWMGGQVVQQEIVMSSVALDEVGNVSPECCDWLNEVGIHQLAVTDEIVQTALDIKIALEIGNQYGIGVGENDLFIIATSAVNGCGLVSNEAVQPQLPLQKPKYKMPAVCAMDGVHVPCVSFIDFVKSSGAVFG
jgi:predicted nucleic acid-binding protein